MAYNKFLLVVAMILLISPVFAADPYEGYIPPSITGAEPLSVVFTDISYGTPTSWMWNRTDVTGANVPITFSLVQNPTYTFYTGNWSIQLITTNAFGTNTSPVVAFVNVSGTAVAPVADFYASSYNITRGSSVSLYDNSTNTPTSWTWNILDPSGTHTYYYTRNATYTPTNAGTTVVGLTAANSAGSSTAVKYINVTVGSTTAPVANFEPIGTPASPFEPWLPWEIIVENGTVVNFTDTSENSPTSWLWTVENSSGTMSLTTRNISILYTTTSATGEWFDIQLAATNSAGTTTMQKRVYVSAPPVSPIPRFDVSVNGATVATGITNGTTASIPVKNGDAIILTDTSYNSPTSWTWNIDMGNGTSLSWYTKNVSFSFTNAAEGSYPGISAFVVTNDAGSGTMDAVNLFYITDTTSPPGISSITNLSGLTTIRWNWTQSADVSTVMVWKDGTWFENVTTNGTLWTGLTANTSYIISTRAVDAAGNVNTTFVNSTKSTSNGIWGYAINGTYVWTCPDDVNRITLREIGGGGSGAPGTATNSVYGLAGELGEIKTVSSIDVTPGATYTIVVGRGGNNTPIGQASKSGTSTIAFGYTALGGAGGAQQSYGGAHNGGNATNSSFNPLVKTAQDGGNITKLPSWAFYGGLGGWGNGAPGGGGAGAAGGSVVDGSGGHGADGYVEIIDYSSVTTNRPDFVADTTTANPGTLIHFADTSIITDSSGLIYNWSFGDYQYSSEIGDTQHVFAYLGSYDISLTISATSGNITETKHAYINIVNAPPSDTGLYPRETSFTLVDRFGRALSGVSVTAIMTSSSVDNTDIFAQWFGLSNSASLNTTLMSDLSDDQGVVVFPMIASGRYHLTFTDTTRGISETRDVHPEQTGYLYILSTTSTAVAENSADFINISLYTYPPASTNPTTVWLAANYTDASSSTVSARFIVMHAANQSVIYNASYSSSVPVSYGVNNVAGAAYVWGIEANTTRFGAMSKYAGITLTGTGSGGLSDNFLRVGCNNWECS